MRTLADFPFTIHHEINSLGRDFVVGDLHGCRGMLEDLLSNVQFDSSIDRVFSVGDLVDRGPDSLATLGLLREPWFYPVLGNHDAMLLAYLGKLDNPVYSNAFVWNGGCNWTDGVDVAELEAAAEPLMEVPFVRVVGRDSPERFQVLHAERVSFDQEDFLSDEELDNPDPIRLRESTWITGFDMRGTWYDRLLWGRSVRREMIESESPFKPGMTTTFVGHTITVGRDSTVVREHANHVFLDSGAYESARQGGSHGFGLTLWNVGENCGSVLRADGFHGVSRVLAEDPKTVV